jgi:uncharacterized protein YhbP (UPF0306 family)
MTFDIARHARELLEANRYATLATADAAGVPWASPVYAAFDSRRLLWVSRPDTRHSRNLAERAACSAVLFDSTVAVGAAAAMYLAGRAGEMAGDDRDRAIGAFSAQSVADGAASWSVADVAGEAPMRLYGLDVDAAWVLDRGADRRLEVALAG